MAKKNPATVTKTDAVKQAVAQLGKDAKGTAIIAFAKDKFNLAISPSHVSNIKSTLKGRRKKRVRRTLAAANAAVVPAPVAASTVVASKNGKAGLAVALDDLERISELAKRYGAAGLTRLVGVMS